MLKIINQFVLRGSVNVGLELPIGLLITQLALKMWSPPTLEASPMDKLDIKIHHRKQNRTHQPEE